LADAHTYYSTLENNMGASNIIDQTGIIAPDITFSLTPKRTFYAEMASDAYESIDYHRIAYSGDESNYPEMFHNNQIVLYKRIDDKTYTDLKIWCPITPLSNLNPPIIIAFKGTEIGDPTQALIDLSLFGNWALGISQYTDFRTDLQNKITYIQNTVYTSGNAHYDTRPKVFTAHFLGCAYATKSYHHFFVNYLSTTNHLYQFNPYILIDSLYHDIVDLSRTNQQFKFSIDSFITATDPVSLSFKRNGYGTIYIYPDIFSGVSVIYDDDDTLKASILSTNPLTAYTNHSNHTINLWTTHGRPLEFRETLYELSLLTNTAIETNNQYNVVMSDESVQAKNLYLRLNEPNLIQEVNYPERSSSQDKYQMIIDYAYNSGHIADNPFTEDFYSVNYQPANNDNDRLRFFSPVYVVLNQIANSYNYFFFHKVDIRDTITYLNQFYISHINYFPPYSRTYYRVNYDGVINIPNQHLLISMEGLETNPLSNDSFTPIYETLSLTQESVSQSLIRHSAIFSFVTGLSIPDTDEHRRKIGTNPGFQPVNRYAFAPGIIPQGPTGSEYVDVRMVFTQYTPHRFIVASETNYLTSVHKDSIWAVDPDDLRYQTFDWRITWIESEQAYDIINIDNNNYSLAQFYLTATPNTGIPLALSSITNKYFDIETLSVGNDIVCLIKSKENLKYVTFSDLWTSTDTYQANPGNDAYGALDPVIFESLLTSNVEKQYIQFASTTSPYDIYSTATGIS